MSFTIAGELLQNLSFVVLSSERVGDMDRIYGMVGEVIFEAHHGHSRPHRFPRQHSGICTII